MENLAIVVKTSRRPWALDRLLTSLEQFLVAAEGLEIHIVDDRTEKLYLDEIVRRHPFVTRVHHSDWGQPKDSTLPYVEAWRRVVRDLEVKWVLILEDDQWLASPLNLNIDLDFIHRNEVWSHWLGVEIDSLTKCLLSKDVSTRNVAYFPRILLRSNRGSPRVGLLAKFLTTTSPVVRKFASLATLIFPNYLSTRWRSLAMLNPMCGAIFERSHWLEMWQGPMPRIDENQQISKALSKIALDGLPQKRFTASPKPFFATTFVSSVSLSLGEPFDWDAANKAWSHEWLNGGLSSPEHVGDWDKAALAEILKNQLGSSASKSYLEWTDKFAKLHGHK